MQNAKLNKQRHTNPPGPINHDDDDDHKSFNYPSTSSTRNTPTTTLSTYRYYAPPSGNGYPSQS